MVRRRMITRRSYTRVLVGLAAIIALLAVAVFGVFTWRSINIETLAEDQAATRFEAARAVFSKNPPILTVAPDGRLRPAVPPLGPVPRPARFRVLAYRAPERRLVTASLPFWFLKMK